MRHQGPRTVRVKVTTHVAPGRLLATGQAGLVAAQEALGPLPASVTTTTAAKAASRKPGGAKRPTSRKAMSLDGRKPLQGRPGQVEPTVLQQGPSTKDVVRQAPRTSVQRRRDVRPAVARSSGSRVGPSSVLHEVGPT